MMNSYDCEVYTKWDFMLQVVVKYQLDKPPKLVEIIAAVPEEHRATLLPQCVLHNLVLFSTVKT